MYIPQLKSGRHGTWNCVILLVLAIMSIAIVLQKSRLGKATVSQYSYLCSASHDISDPSLRLTSAPIVISDGAWVFADAFIGPGVTIGEGAVVGARASVFKDVDAWVVVGGNPARFIKKRVLRD